MSGRSDDKSIEPAHQSPLRDIMRSMDALTDLERKVARIEAEVERLVLRLSDAEDQRADLINLRVEALERIAREIALAGSIGDKDFARRACDDILVRMDAPRDDTAAAPSGAKAEPKYVLLVDRSDLAAALEKAKGRVMSDDEIKAQRESYVRGEMGFGSDRDETAYREALAKGQKKRPRETRWAVVLDGQLPTVLIASETWFAFTPLCAALTVDIHWLGCRADAEALARLLCVGRAAELDKETLKEVT